MGKEPMWQRIVYWILTVPLKWKQLWCNHEIYKDLRMPIENGWGFCHGICSCIKCDKDFSFKADLATVDEGIKEIRKGEI